MRLEHSLQPYAEYQSLAFISRAILFSVKTLIEQGPKGAAEAMAAIDRALHAFEFGLLE